MTKGNGSGPGGLSPPKPESLSFSRQLRTGRLGRAWLSPFWTVGSLHAPPGSEYHRVFFDGRFLDEGTDRQWLLPALTDRNRTAGSALDTGPDTSVSILIAGGGAGLRRTPTSTLCPKTCP